MSINYIKKVNDTPLAASEVIPSSELDTKLKNLKNRWNDNYGNMKTSSTTSAVWAKLATIAYPSGLDGENAVYGKIELHQYTTTKLAADFSLLFPSGSLAICNGNFTSGNIGNIKMGFVVDSTNRTVDLYGYISGYAYSGIRLIIDDITRYHGATVDAAVQYYKDATLLSSEPSGIVYCANDNGAVQSNIADYVKYQHTNEINYKNVADSEGNARNWFNYRNGDTDAADSTNKITDYFFGNRNNGTTDVYLHADGFAPRLITGGGGNVLPFAKFTLTNTGTNKGFVHFRCVFIGTNSSSDAMGQTDITIKIEQNTWYGLATKSVRNGGMSSYSYGDFGNFIYWESGSTVYIGVRPGSYYGKVCVFVQYCQLNDTATYTLGNYYSEVTSLAIHEGCNRDVSLPYRASITSNTRAINIENYLKIEIPLGNNHRHASITIFGDNGAYPFIANIGFQFLTSPGSGESAGFQTAPVLSMVECNNLSSNAYVPNVWYINNGSSGSGYIYCKWSNNKRLTVLLNTFDPKAIVLSDVSSLPSEAVAVANGHSIPHMNGINSQVGSSSLPVYVTSSGEVSPVGSQLILPGASSGEGYVRAGYGSNNLAYLDANSTKTGLWCKTNINSGDANGGWVCYRDTAGNNVFNGSAESVTGINANTRNTSTYRLALGYTSTLDSDGHARAIVTLHSDSSLGSAGSGIGATVLVSVDWEGNSTDRHVSTRVLNNDAFASNIMPGVIVTTDSNNLLHFYVVLLGRSSNDANYELKPFNYTSTYVIKLGGTMNWVWDLGHDSTSTISSSDYIFPAEDCVTYVCQPPSSVIGSGSPAADCAAYWTNYVGKGSMKTVYNNLGQEYTLLFSKSADGKYGTILRWSYRGPSSANVSRIEMLRCHNNSWLTSDWEGLSVDNATNATNATNADMVDYTHIVCGTLGSENNTIYFT